MKAGTKNTIAPPGHASHLAPVQPRSKARSPSQTAPAVMTEPTSKTKAVFRGFSVALENILGKYAPARCSTESEIVLHRTKRGGPYT